MRVTNASGHVWMGHVVGNGGVVRDAVLTLGGRAVSSSLDSFAWSFSAPHPIRTGNAGSRVSRMTGAPIRGVARWLPKDHSVLALDRIEEPSPWVFTRGRLLCPLAFRHAIFFFSFVWVQVRGSALLRLPGASLLVHLFSVRLLRFIVVFLYLLCRVRFFGDS